MFVLGVRVQLAQMQEPTFDQLTNAGPGSFMAGQIAALACMMQDVWRVRCGHNCP